MDNTNNSTKRKKHYMSPFQTPKEHKRSRTQEQEHLFVQDQLHLSPIVLSPLLTLPPPLDPVMTSFQGGRESQENKNASFTWEPTATSMITNENDARFFSTFGETFIVNEQERNNDYKNSPLFNDYENDDMITHTNRSNTDSTISSKRAYAAQQLMNLHQGTVKTNEPPQVPEVSEYDWSTSSQLNTGVVNNNNVFFDSSYLDRADLPILNRKKSSFSDINQLDTAYPSGFQQPASSFEQRDGNSIDNKNLFEPIQLTRTTVRESQNQVPCLLPKEKDNLSDEDVKQFLHKMTSEQKFLVYKELNNEFYRKICNSHSQTSEELKNSFVSTKLSSTSSMNNQNGEDYDLQGLSEENNNITTHDYNAIKKDADCESIVKECSFRRGTGIIEGRAYFKSLSSLAFEEKLHYIVQTIEKVSRQLHIGYVERDRKFLHRIWNVYKCFTQHCKCDLKIFASKYGKVAHAEFQCICQETVVDSDDEGLN